VRSPTTTGKIERFHQSLRKEFLADRSFTSLDNAQAELDRWVTDYNTVGDRQAIPMNRGRASTTDPRCRRAVGSHRSTHYE